jgi:hypothetical protein
MIDCVYLILSILLILSRNSDLFILSRGSSRAIGTARKTESTGETVATRAERTGQAGRGSILHRAVARLADTEHDVVALRGFWGGRWSLPAAGRAELT